MLSLRVVDNALLFGNEAPNFAFSSNDLLIRTGTNYLRRAVGILFEPLLFTTQKLKFLRSVLVYTLKAKVCVGVIIVARRRNLLASQHSLTQYYYLETQVRWTNHISLNG
jgi:hypothetical protein